jgi:hypothetical protein
MTTNGYTRLHSKSKGFPYAQQHEKEPRSTKKPRMGVSDEWLTKSGTGVASFMLWFLMGAVISQVEQLAAQQLERIVQDGTCLSVPQLGNSASKNMAALWLRATFHAAGTWKPGDSIPGGFDDLLVQTVTLKENTGMEESLAHKFTSEPLSNADKLALGGIVGIQVCGGPQISFATGRKDLRQRTVLTNRIPSASQSYDTIKNRLREMGWTNEDIVALATGSHTLGGAHQRNSPGITNKEFVPFDDTPGIFDNHIFRFSLQGKCIVQFDCDIANDPEMRPLVQRCFLLM